MTGSWEQMSGGRSAPYMMHDSRMGNYPRDSQTELTLAGTIDLTDAEAPVLTFWHKRAFFTDHSYYNHNEDDYGRVYVSPDNGGIWYSKAAYGGSSTSWTKETIDLSEFVGMAALKIRFRINDREDLNYPGTNRQADGWYIDDVRVGENLALPALPDLVRLIGHGRDLFRARPCQPEVDRRREGARCDRCCRCRSQRAGAVRRRSARIDPHGHNMDVVHRRVSGGRQRRRRVLRLGRCGYARRLLGRFPGVDQRRRDVGFTETLTATIWQVAA